MWLYRNPAEKRSLINMVDYFMLSSDKPWSGLLDVFDVSLSVSLSDVL